MITPFPVGDVTIEAYLFGNFGPKLEHYWINKGV